MTVTSSPKTRLTTPHAIATRNPSILRPVARRSSGCTPMVTDCRPPPGQSADTACCFGGCCSAPTATGSSAHPVRTDAAAIAANDLRTQPDDDGPMLSLREVTGGQISHNPVQRQCGYTRRMPATPSAAPGRLDVVRRLINTRDIEAGTDALSTPRGCVRWLRQEGLLARSVSTFSRAEADQLVAVREALRSALAAGEGGLDDDVLAELNSAAEAACLTIRFTPTGSWKVHSSADGVWQAIGRLVSIVIEAMADGTWSRLKVCADDGCRWAFYDRSRARSARWCSMRVCGNRAKQRAWRAREVPRGRLVP